MISKSNKYIKLFFQMLLLICLFFSIVTNAQKDTLCFDEADHLISKALFNKKISSNIYHGLQLDTDTLVIQKVRFNYCFGNLQPTIKSQLFKLLSSRHQIDTTKTLVIHYIDTLRSISEFPKQNSVVYKDSLGNIIPIKKNGSSFDLASARNIKTHEHILNHQSFVKQHERCLKDHKKLKANIEVLHFYAVNNGHPEQVSDVKWYKDYGSVLKKVFSDGYKNFNNIIVHPNGDFYMQSFKSEIPYKDLVKKIKWSEYEQHFNKKVETLNSLNI